MSVSIRKDVKKIFVVLFLMFQLGISSAMAGLSLQEGVRELAQQIVDNSITKGKVSIAVSSFANSNGEKSELSLHIADELVLNLFSIPNANINIIEREKLNSIFQEMKFNMTGVVDSKTIQKLGKIHGVDALVLGSIAEMGSVVRINARVADTETGELTSVAAITVDKSHDVKELLSRAIKKNVTKKPGGAPSVEKNSENVYKGDKELLSVDQNTTAFFRKLQQYANTNHIVKIRPVKEIFKIGRDYLEMTVTSSKAGHLTILSLGSSGKIYQVFPNKLDTENEIYPQSKLFIPSGSWKLPALGPAGIDQFMAIVSSTPEPFKGFGVPVGPFMKIDSDRVNLSGIVRRLNKAPSDCGSSVAFDTCKKLCDSKTRDFGVVVSGKCVEQCKSNVRDFGAVAIKRKCTKSYGAGWMQVREVN